MGGMQSRIWSAGRIPSQSICAFDPATVGKTSPGQSHSRSDGTSGTRSVWKCFVFPGVADTDVFFCATNTLTVDDFPTLG